MLQCLMELILYFFLMRVFCVFNNFLGSVDASWMDDSEVAALKKSKQIFCFLLITVIFLALFNSVYSLMAPYLYFSQLNNKKASLIFTFAWESFFVANTLFSLITLYANHHF